MRNRQSHPSQICGDDCRYRKLYEGSQRSLTDMAARQVQAVARVGRLRNQLILAAKRAFPRTFTHAERTMGIRMSDSPDEVVVAYLESFLQGSVGADAGGALELLRDALGDIGIPVPGGSDLSEWADSVRQYGLDRRDPFATPVAAAPPTPNGSTASGGGVANRTLTAPAHETGVAGPGRDLRPSAPTAGVGAAGYSAVTRRVDDTDDLFDLFDDPAGDDVSMPAAPELERNGTEPAGVAADKVHSDVVTDVPAVAAVADVVVGGGDDNDGDSFDGDLGGEIVGEGLDGELSDLFADDLLGDLLTGDGSGGGLGATVDSGGFGDDGFGAALGGDDGFGFEQLDAADTSEVAALGGQAALPARPAETENAEPVPGRRPLVRPEPDRTSQPQPQPVVAAAGPSATSPTDRTADTGGGPVDGAPLPAWATGKTVKPQLFPAAPKTTGRKDRKPTRVRALPADMPDVPVAETDRLDTGELTDDVRARLLAMASISRPVFTSDLVAAVGSEDLVTLWRQEWQDGDLAVRFVLPKPRHRNRGALVVPQAALKAADSAYAASWWGRCTERYRGARIYELGVFFHRFAEQVISFEDDRGVISVRMSLPQGLTGAVLVAETQLGVGGETRDGLFDALDRLLGDRLVHIAVLVMNAEQFEPVAEAVEAAAKERQWRASMPVTLSRSWEYTDGTGTAVPLLGV
jgi:hypothetical protein